MDRQKFITFFFFLKCTKNKTKNPHARKAGKHSSWMAFIRFVCEKKKSVSLSIFRILRWKIRSQTGFLYSSPPLFFISRFYRVSTAAGGSFIWKDSDSEFISERHYTSKKKHKIWDRIYAAANAVGLNDREMKTVRKNGKAWRMQPEQASSHIHTHTWLTCSCTFFG